MAYYVNKTDGTAILVLDGTKDTTSTSLTLIGKLSSNYGEVQNENFVHLLENFALSISPAYPIAGQLWYDTSTDNIKSYNGTKWTTVGSSIVGNVSLTGNLFVGPNGFQIQDLGDVSITNKVSGGDISLYANVAGTNTRALYINGGTGLVEAAANATANYGLTTKIYVDSLLNAVYTNANSYSSTNFTAVYANLATRTTEENSLRANIAAANISILTINSQLSSSIISNVSTLTSSVTAANTAIVTANVNMKSYVDDQITHISLTPGPQGPAGATGATGAQGPAGSNATIPSGIVVMWSGSSATIPSGWLLCNGANGTPDLRDRFVIGAGNTYNVGANGGSKDATLISHSHGASVNEDAHKHFISAIHIDNRDFSGTGRTNYQHHGLVADGDPETPGQNDPNKAAGSYTTSATTGITVSINPQGSGNGINANLPPYYALCYIMKS
jgi:hypothetical protein